MVENHRVHTAGRDPLQAAGSIERDLRAEAMPLQIFFDEEAKSFIIVDKEDVDASILHHCVSGT